MLAVAAAALLTLTVGGAEARHRRHADDAAPGDFAYFVLALSWSPAFCLTSPHTPECDGPRRYGLVVHGLWPQYERGWPEHCQPQSDVPDEVERGMLDLMPARALIEHEWSAHGTCSGLAAADFFALVRRAYGSLSIPDALAHPTRAIDISPQSIAAGFAGANRRLTPRSLVIVCGGQGAPRLREIRVCLDRALVPRDCSPDTLHAACKADRVIVPPVR